MKRASSMIDRSPGIRLENTNNACNENWGGAGMEWRLRTGVPANDLAGGFYRTRAGVWSAAILQSTYGGGLISGVYRGKTTKKRLRREDVQRYGGISKQSGQAYILLVLTAHSCLISTS